jgi:putative phage-type endonuclease
MQGIGASDIPILTGNSPYISKKQLFLQKKGIRNPPIINEHIIKISNQVEEDAIIFFKENREIIFTPLCAESDQNSLLRASLDGWNDKEGVLECKFVSFDYYNELKNNKKIRLDHQDQMQFQMLITGKKFVTYYAQNSQGEYQILKLEEDKKYQKKLEVLALNFLNELNIGLN